MKIFQSNTGRGSIENLWPCAMHIIKECRIQTLVVHVGVTWFPTEYQLPYVLRNIPARKTIGQLARRVPKPIAIYSLVVRGAVNKQIIEGVVITKNNVDISAWAGRNRDLDGFRRSNRSDIYNNNNKRQYS